MARPKKNTVDYFPHKCTSGKTIFILEQKFNNDGYAFWFKLLQLLGSKEGHFIDCNNPSELEFLQAITRTSDITTIEILNLCAKLEAIDPELWSVKVIWSQNFVDGISHVYENRRVETPSKPSFYMPKPTLAPISTADNPHSIVEYSIVTKSKVEGRKKKTFFIAPSLTEVHEYFKEKGFSPQSAEKAFNYYHEADWHDSTGKKIKNWKQKMQGVWFKDENKIQKNVQKEQQITGDRTRKPWTG